MTDLTPPRGTADLVPPGSEVMFGRYAAAHSLARLWGFRYMETPVFEQTELFSRTSGQTSDIVSKEMYTFEDKGGRSMTLRPESTAGVVRAYLAHAQELGQPFRAYYVNTNYRHNRPQAGRLREFRVFGAEVIGSSDPRADVEVISLAHAYLEGSGLRDTSLHLNSIGDGACRPAYRELLVAYFERYLADLDEDCRARLNVNPLRVFDCKTDANKEFVKAAPTIAEHLCGPCSDHIAGVEEGLKSAGIPFERDPKLVRGLDYYTRTAFEFIHGSSDSQAATICGGGRYDGLAELLGGTPTPGVGFGIGLDRVVAALASESGTGAASLEAPRPLDVFVVCVGEGARDAGEALVKALRADGISAATSFEERPMKAQMKMADRAEAGFAALIGEREVAQGTVTLRRLSDGAQTEAPIDQVTSAIQRTDGWVTGDRS